MDVSKKPDQEPDMPSAAALGYRPGNDHAPRLLAKGRGQIALKILEVARARGIPIYEDPQLLRALESLELDQEIPSSLYEAVAGVLAFIYRLDAERLEHLVNHSHDTR